MTKDIKVKKIKMTTWETKELKKANQNQTVSEEGYSLCSRTTYHRGFVEWPCGQTTF